MTLHVLETILRLKELELFENKYTSNLLQNITENNIQTVFKDLLELKNVTNKELTIIFDVLLFYYTKEAINTQDSHYYVEYTFTLETKDLDIALLSYFRFLHHIYISTHENAEYVTKYFQKCYNAISNKITRSAILREIYFCLRDIMKKDTQFLDIFMQNEYYKRFLFFNIFFNDFYATFSEKQAVELFMHTKHNFQCELLIHGRKFNPYLVLLKPNFVDKMTFDSSFYLIDCNILNNNLLSKKISKCPKSFLDLFRDSVEIKSTDTCIFSDLHNKRQDLIDILDNLKSALDHFNKKKDLALLDQYFDNPIYFLRASTNTDLRVLGDFIGKEKNKQFLEVFCSTFDTEQMSLIDALRTFLTSFVLPGESQVIVRILEQFSINFYNQKIGLEKANKSENVIDIDEPGDTKNDANFTQQDIYIIVYALIMLNTNLHNVNIKLKSNKKTFIENMRKCKISEKFNDRYLSNLYDDVRKTPFKFTDKNTYNTTNHKMYNLAIENVKDDKTKKILALLHPNDYLSNIQNNTCTECKNRAYKTIFTKFADTIIKYCFSQKTPRDIKTLLNICKHYNDMDVCLKVLTYMLENYNEEFLEHFFSLYMFCLEDSNICKKLNSTHSTDISFYNLPLYVIQKHYIHAKMDKNVIFKKENHSFEDNEKIINKFIRSSASINDKVFKNLIEYNLCIEDNETLETIFEIALKNSFRANKIITSGFMQVLSNSNVYLNLFIDKIIELRLKTEILEILKTLQTIKYSTENIVFNIVKNSPEIVDDKLALFVLESINDETNVHFNILIHLQKSYNSFEFISGQMIDMLYDAIDNKEKISLSTITARERFSAFLAVPSKFIPYCLSSKEYINFRVLDKIETKNPDFCMLSDTAITKNIYRQITYAIIKCSANYTQDMIQYYKAYLRALCKSICLLLSYLSTHLWIFTLLNRDARSVIIEKVVFCINEYNNNPLECKCSTKHDLDSCINTIEEFLVNNKMISKNVINAKSKQIEEKMPKDNKQTQVTNSITNKATDQVFEL